MTISYMMYLTCLSLFQLTGFSSNTLMQKGTLYYGMQGYIVFVVFDEDGKARFTSISV